LFFFFFFQAEDGIRDWSVTGVQTCALPIYLGLRQVRVMSNNPRKIQVLGECGLDVTERIPLEVPPTAPALRYLRTKKEKMGHLLVAV